MERLAGRYIGSIVVCTVCFAAVGAAAQPAGVQAKAFTFDGKEALAGWTITGDVTIDAAKGREGRNGSLKVGPGGKAVLKLRDRDESGKVEFWVYDDGTAPEDAKASRLGPRWGLVQSDGKLLAVGVLYAGYLGGAEGYTATACDGRDWFNQLFWLGVIAPRQAGTNGPSISILRWACRSFTMTRRPPRWTPSRRA